MKLEILFFPEILVIDLRERVIIGMAFQAINNY